MELNPQMTGPGDLRQFRDRKRRVRVRLDRGAIVLNRFIDVFLVPLARVRSFNGVRMRNRVQVVRGRLIDLLVARLAPRGNGQRGNRKKRSEHQTQYSGCPAAKGRVAV